MQIPDTLDSFLKPQALAPPADKDQLPPNLPRQLDSVINHYQNKQGNLMLFIGASITGNIAATKLLGELMNREVYRIDLSAVVSKHLGETEKNLLQVFEFAEKHRFILFFDEADSLFGKRNGLRLVDDRYANLEIAYLLKRIAAYSGMVVVTTNARDDIDGSLLEAVPWQIDLSHHATQRLSLWQRLFKRP